jgi:peptidoglycan L-alanyl-D-glutamate endopeptidase CwlK
MASRSLDDLHPDLRPLCQWFLEQCEVQDIHPLITCTYRSHAEQEALYAQGRSQPGKIVTDARGGKSRHNFTLNGKPASKAFDVAPIINGKIEWSDKHPVWAHMGEIGESVGLEWGGNWTGKLRDMPHFQMRE